MPGRQIEGLGGSHQGRTRRMGECKPDSRSISSHADDSRSGDFYGRRDQEWCAGDAQLAQPDGGFTDGTPAFCSAAERRHSEPPWGVERGSVGRRRRDESESIGIEVSNQKYPRYVGCGYEAKESQLSANASELNGEHRARDFLPPFPESISSASSCSLVRGWRPGCPDEGISTPSSQKRA